MGLCAWLVFGFIIGLIARALMPGDQPMGFIKTSLLGVGGSFVGGFIGSMLWGSNLHRLHASGWIGSIIGAIVLLALGQWLFKPSRS